MFVTRSVGCAVAAAFLLSFAPHAQAEPTSPPAPRPGPTAATPAGAAATPATPAPSLDFEAQLDALLGTTGGLTSDEAAQRALKHSPQVRASHEQERAARAALRSEKTGWIPTLTLDSSYTRLSSVDQPEIMGFTIPFPLNRYANSLTLAIPLTRYLFVQPKATQAASAGVAAARAQTDIDRADVALNAKRAYYEWVRARLAEVVARLSIVELDASLASTQARATAGRATRADVLRIQAQKSTAELNLSRAVEATRLSQDQLETLMGVGTDENLAIGEDIRKDLPPLEPVRRSPAEIVRSRPEGAALDAQETAALARAKAAGAGALPEVSLFAAAQYDNPNQRVFFSGSEFRSSWNAGASLRWTFGNIPRSLADRAQARAQASAVAAQRDQLIDGVRVELASAEARVRLAEASIVTSRNGLAAAEESYRVTRALYDAGRVTVVALVDSESQLTRSRLDALDAAIDLRIAIAELDRTLGQVP